MGYRSKVCIRTSAKGLKLLQDAWNSASEVSLADSLDGFYQNGDVVTLVFGEIKWDGGHPEVQAVESLMQVDGLDGEPWSFVRCGEEQGDYEELHSDGLADRPDYEKYLLYAAQYIEGLDGLPIVPDFSLREFTLLTMTMYEHLEQTQPEVANTVLANSALLQEMVAERDRQKGEQDD